MLNESDHDRKPNVVLIDADIPNDPLLYNDILNKFEENIPEKSNRNVISNNTYPIMYLLLVGELFNAKYQY
ncbi:unnamed protein product [Schistosoma curassoni]|uniref:Uncharacterized protein n=1 Tax=Schistosoma curassoni TaxID=6186 RepID=A0A183K8Z2_9TREM|nr:unnamed protein product [Schistosoma curassoni]